MNSTIFSKSSHPNQKGPKVNSSDHFLRLPLNERHPPWNKNQQEKTLKTLETHGCFQNRVPPKSSILIGFPLQTIHFGVPILLETTHPVARSYHRVAKPLRLSRRDAALEENHRLGGAAEGARLGDTQETNHMVARGAIWWINDIVIQFIRLLIDYDWIYFIFYSIHIMI